MKTSNNAPFCNSGNNFYVLAANGDCYRCFSASANRHAIGNVFKLGAVPRLSGDAMTCPYGVECADIGCRKGCDFAETMRFDPTTGDVLDKGKEYKLTPIVNLREMRPEADFYWFLTHTCNYNCLYCNSKHASEWTDGPGEATTKQLLQALNIMCEQFDSLHLTLTGGEPSFHPGFVRFAKAVHERTDKIDLRILTNMHEHEKLLEVFSWNWPRKMSLQVFASCHFSEPGFDLDKFVQLCALVDACNFLEISTVNHPHEGPWHQEYFDYFRSLGFERLYHQYYSENRARSKKVSEKFKPKTLDLLRRRKNGAPTFVDL